MTPYILEDNNNSLCLRFNHLLNCWQLYNYLRFTNKPREWKWFHITAEQARMYAGWKIPVSVEETVS